LGAVKVGALGLAFFEAGEVAGVIGEEGAEVSGDGRGDLAGFELGFESLVCGHLGDLGGGGFGWVLEGVRRWGPGL
jgi:hypothetical protein